MVSLDGTPVVLSSRTFTVDTSGGSFGQDVTSVLLRCGKAFGMESGHYRDREAIGLHADVVWQSAQISEDAM